MTAEAQVRTDTPATGSVPSDHQASGHNVDKPNPQAEPKPAKKKDPYFSNAKFLLILMVVCGHSWSGLISESHSVRAFYMTLYDFHMPAFILLCGFFSKSFVGRPDQLKRLVTGTLAPYLVFSLLYAALRIWTEDTFHPNLLTPYYLTWFLAALFVWRVTSPVWRIIKHPIVVSTVISIGAVMIDLPDVMDIGRILQFLPFFVAGMYLKREHFEMLKRPLIRYTATALSLAVIVTSFAFGGELNRNWVYFNEGAEQMDLDRTTALPLKLLLLATSITLVITFLSWVPDRQLPFSKLGEYTMYTYLLHGFVVMSIEDGFGLYEPPFVHSAIGAITVTLAALSLGLLLMTKPIRWLTRPLIEPKLNWLLKMPDPPTKPPPQPPQTAAPPQPTS